MSLPDTVGATETGTAPAAHRKLGLALLVIATAQLMLVLDDTIVNVALPTIQRSLHVPASHLNWVASFYALTFGGLLLAGGRAGDLFGRLRMFRGGLIAFAASCSSTFPSRSPSCSPAGSWSPGTASTARSTWPAR